MTAAWGSLVACSARQLVAGELYLRAAKPEVEEPLRRGRPPKRRKADETRPLELGCKQSPLKVHWAWPSLVSEKAVADPLPPFSDRDSVPFGSSLCDCCAAERQPVQLELFEVSLHGSELLSQKRSAYLCPACAAALRCDCATFFFENRAFEY